MSRPEDPLQLHFAKIPTRYFGVRSEHSIVIDFWLDHNRLTYSAFYSSFVNWAVKIAMNYKQSGNAKLKPGEVNIRNALHGQKFLNPFDFIAILVYFWNNVYQRVPMRGWIKNHDDEKQVLGGMRQLWSILYSRPRVSRKVLAAPRRDDATMEDDEGEDEGQDEGQDEREPSGGVQVDADGDLIPRQPVSPRAGGTPE